MLAYLLEDIFGILFAAFCHEQPKFDEVRGLDYVNVKEPLLPFFASFDVHLSEDFQGPLFSA
jgi:hypothetical protein